MTIDTISRTLQIKARSIVIFSVKIIVQDTNKISLKAIKVGILTRANSLNVALKFSSDIDFSVLKNQTFSTKIPYASTILFLII